MRFLVPLGVKFSLTVSDGGWPHIRIQMSDLWDFFMEVGATDSDSYHYRFLHKYSQTQPTKSLRYNPTSWFGKAIRRVSLPNFIIFTQGVMFYSAWTRNYYYLQRRIRPHLLQKLKPKIPFHKLIRFRLIPPLKPTTPLTPSFSHKSTFQPIYFTPTTPLLLLPPSPQPFGLSLPRRHPREGVG